jgi:uncharacterized protein YkwD
VSKSFLFLFFSFVLLLSITGCGASDSSTNSSSNDPSHISNPKPYPQDQTPVLTDDDKAAFLQAVNEARSVARQCGDTSYDPSPALTWSDPLYHAAVEHNEDMIQSHIVDTNHRGSGTASDYTMKAQDLGHASYFQERIENNGYTLWSSVGENLTLGSPTIDKAMDELLKSPGHCANIMNPKFTQMGMSYIHVDEDSLGFYDYWTQDFAAQ